MITPKPKKPYLGRAVENGKIRFFSVSSLTSADPKQYGGCLRRWHLRYIGMHKGEEFQAQKTGTQVHDEIRHYLTTGEDVLGRIARAAKPFIPHRGPDLRVEHDINDGLLTAAGIPVIGDIDLAHTRGQYINPLGDLEADLTGTGEVIDWKSTGRMDNAKSGSELLETIQMVGYGEWLARDLPTIEHVRLSHVYIGTKGTPDACKSTVRVPREEIARRWEQTESLARTIVDIAREPDSSKVDPNPLACSAYSGCPYANNQCRITQTQSLEGILGRAMARRLNHQTTDLLTITPAPEAPTLPGLLDLIPPGTPGTSSTIPTLPPNNPMAAALAALQAQEEASAPPPPPAPDLAARLAFGAAVKHIKASGMGMPPLTGEAASVYCVNVGILPVADQPGSGKLVGLPPVQTMSQVMELAVALGFAGSPVADLTMGTGKGNSPPPPQAQAADLPALVQPGAPVPSVEKGDAAAPLAGYVPPPEGEEGEKKKRGRPPGSKTKVTAPATPPAPVENPVVADTPVTRGGLEIYVDSIPFTPFSYLDAYVEGVTSAIAQAYQVPDIRAVSVKDNPLSFGGWRAVLGAYVRENPPPPGIYVADTANGHREPVLVVADALRSLCTGGARGIR